MLLICTHFDHPPIFDWIKGWQVNHTNDLRALASVDMDRCLVGCT